MHTWKHNPSPPHSWVYLSTKGIQMCGPRQLPPEHLSICGARGGKSLPWRSILISVHLSALLSILDSGMWREAELNHPSPQILSLLRSVSANIGTYGPPVVQGGSHSLQSVSVSLFSKVHGRKHICKHWTVARREGWRHRMALRLVKVLNTYDMGFSLTRLPSIINIKFNFLSSKFHHYCELFSHL